ncbi:sigma-70 region 4 domain-containing protein [Kitasatospora sp. NPDC004531]
MSRSHEPATADCGYDAFVQLHCRGYQAYARARLGDGALAGRVVEQVLRRAESSWTQALNDGPAAFTWRVLHDSVTLASRQACDLELDRLHRALPARVADAALLHGLLGMAPREAAELMGLNEPQLHVQLMAARRMLAAGGGEGAEV